MDQKATWQAQTILSFCKINVSSRKTGHQLAGAYTGTSYNHYDSQTGKWNQLWLDNQGGSLQLTGGLTDGKMILTGAPSPGGDGKNYISRITWTPNEHGSVRQHWEAQVEGEEEWQTWFNGLDKKKK
ncbi:MAG: hypothetical protein GY751_04940 [Bacteroidetes bacterium]|nr:hypothetical protein [Bacteroidota bacterium]